MKSLFDAFLSRVSNPQKSTKSTNDKAGFALFVPLAYNQPATA
jgi:hypothetical protein